MTKEQYSNIDSDVLSLLKYFFLELENKITDKNDTKLLNSIFSDIKKYPNKTDQNVHVSFEYDNSIYYVTYSDQKIELTDYVIDYYEDEDGNKSDFSQIQQYIFSYEIGGYKDVNGNIDEFKELLLMAIKNVPVNDIEISVEE